MNLNQPILNPNISVDCVIFGFDGEQLNVLLVDRVLNDPKTGNVLFSDFTLTGNHIYEHEDLDDAAQRILFDLTGLKNIYLDQFGAFSHPDRLKKTADQKWLMASGRNPYNRIATIAFFRCYRQKR
jgi:8-oxo-dGTP diphosphatase